MPKSKIIGFRNGNRKATLSHGLVGKICLQSEAMIASAGKDKCVTAMRHDKTGRWHGILLINHPTPSGNGRWIRIFSDGRGYATRTIAIKRFCKYLSEETKR
jgi:hypothetical protein